MITKGLQLKFEEPIVVTGDYGAVAIYEAEVVEVRPSRIGWSDYYFLQTQLFEQPIYVTEAVLREALSESDDRQFFPEYYGGSGNE